MDWFLHDNGLRHKELRRLYDLIINTIANLFLYERLKIPEVYSEPTQTSKMELFVKIS